MTATHPSPNDLADFANGGLARAAWDEVERHVAACPHCFRVLQSLPESPLSRRARDAVRRVSVSDHTPFPGPPPGLRPTT